VAATTTGARNSATVTQHGDADDLAVSRITSSDGRAGQQRGSGLDRLLGEPVVEFGAKDGVPLYGGRSDSWVSKLTLKVPRQHEGEIS